VQFLSLVNEKEASRVGPSSEPWTFQVNVIPLPGGAHNKNNFERITVVTVVGVQELVQDQLCLTAPSLTTDDGRVRLPLHC